MKIHKIAEKFADFLIGNPWKTLLAGILLVGVLAPGLGRLGTDFSYRIWFREDDPLLQKFDAFERRFGNDDSAIVAIYSPSGIFDPESAQIVRSLTEEMWTAPEVIRVDSISNYNWVHADGDDIMVDPFLPKDQELTPEFLAKRKDIALNDETIPNYLVSRDGKTALIYATISPKLNGTADYKHIVEGVNAIVDKYRGQGDHEFHLSGNASLSDGFRESTEIDFETLVPIVLLVTIFFLATSFRSALGVGLSLLVVFLTIMATMGTYGWLGIKINNTTAIVPQILIAVAVADSVHILVNFFRAFWSGMDRKAAARYTLVKNFLPTILTSLSTAMGFFSFATAKIVPIASMGVGAGVGTLYAWFLTYLILAPLMVLLPIKGRRVMENAKPRTVSPFAEKYSQWLDRHGRWILTASLLIGVVGLWLTSKNEINSDPFKYFAKDYHVTVANQFLEDHVGGGMGPEIVIDSGVDDGIKDPAFLRKVEAYQNWVGSHSYVSKTVSIIDILKAMNRSLHGDDQKYYQIPDSKEAVAQLLFLYTMSLPRGMDINNRVTIKNDALRLTALWTMHDSNTGLQKIAEFEKKAEEMGLNARVTGKLPLYQGMNGYVVPAFLVSIFLATLLVSLLMGFSLQSWKMGLLAMVPNVLPLIFGGAMIYILGIYVDVGVVVVGSVCLGIAVDDTIHFMANYKKLLDSGMKAREAIADIFTHTAPALVITTVVLVASFGTFIFATFIPNSNFGKLVALILSFALVADLVLLPTLLLKAARRREGVAAPEGRLASQN